MITIGMVGIAHADNWTGYYAGGEMGFVFNNVQLKSQQLGFTNPSGNCNTSSDYSTFFPGIQLGYMYPLPYYFVSGIEGNVAFNTNQKNTLNCTCPFNPGVSDSFSFRNQMQGSIRGRVGRNMYWNQNSFLPYLTVGASFANVGLSYSNEGGDYYSKNTTQAGWLLGAGIEWAFWQNWSLRAEYFYADYGNTIKLKIPSVYGLVDPNGKARVDLSSNNIAVAINYWI